MFKKSIHGTILVPWDQEFGPTVDQPSVGVVISPTQKVNFAFVVSGRTGNPALHETLSEWVKQLNQLMLKVILPDNVLNHMQGAEMTSGRASSWKIWTADTVPGSF